MPGIILEQLSRRACLLGARIRLQNAHRCNELARDRAAKGEADRAAFWRKQADRHLMHAADFRRSVPRA